MSLLFDFLFCPIHGVIPALAPVLGSMWAWVRCARCWGRDR